jgi:alpha-L-fucosidase 2
MLHSVLHLNTPATVWENATPVGCGSLGAMLYGGIDEECLQLNEEHIWAEMTHSIDTSDFYERFLTVRKALQAGKNADALAKELLNPYFGGVGSYETAGELRLDVLHAEDAPTTDYRRDLDLTNGVATVTYTRGKTAYRRTLFASYPQRMVVLQLCAEYPGRIFPAECNLNSFQ